MRPALALLLLLAGTWLLVTLCRTYPSPLSLPAALIALALLGRAAAAIWPEDDSPSTSGGSA